MKVILEEGYDPRFLLWQCFGIAEEDHDNAEALLSVLGRFHTEYSRLDNTEFDYYIY